jgi:nucleoside-diphosphate-sugar epimerase
MAEEMALEYGLKNGLHVATVLPGLVLGPLLQHVAINTTSKVLIYILKGLSCECKNYFLQHFFLSIYHKYI